MAGNSQRRGATRKAGSKKPRTVGSGGQRRQQLEGKGPTPKATERPGHKAYRAAKRPAAPGSGAAKRPAAPGSGAAKPRRPAAGRGEPTAEVVAGRNPVVEALRAGVPALTLYVAERIDADDRVREAVRLAGHHGIALLEVPRAELDRIASGAQHQGLGLKVPPYRYAEPDDLLDSAYAAGQAPLVVALDGVTDPRNLGAVVRSAAAFGAHGVIVPERRSAGMTASAWKTSAGAAALVPVARVGNLNRALASLQERGTFIVGLDAGGSLPLPDLDRGLAAGPLVLVVGGEDKGLSRLVAARCDVVVSIPMHAGTESLNAGVAAGIALYAISMAR